MKIVAISDTHNLHDRIVIPECDVLVHCGDYSFNGRPREIFDFYNWLNKQPAKHKLSIQGNHEVGWEESEEEAKKLALECCPDVHLLHDSGVEIDGVKFYGLPWTPWFHDWAYNAGRNPTEAARYCVPEMKTYTDKIPEGTNVLLTHGPPYMILDEVPSRELIRYVGCEDLLKRIKQIKPDLHFFGHIHCDYGEKHVDGTSFYNVAICDEQYRATNSIRIVEYEKTDTSY